MSCERFAHLDAAYVLGALPPAERREFERHLDSCESCARSVRELAGMPGLLSRVEAAEVAHLQAAEPVPSGLLPTVLERARKERRRRRRASVGALVAAAVLLVTGTWVLADRFVPGRDVPRESPLTAQETPDGAVMTPVGQDRLAADLGLQEVAWGTRIQLRCRYSGTPESVAGLPAYVLVVRTRDGGAERVASWRAVAGKTATIVAATASRASDIDSVDVETTSGRVLLHLDR